MLLPPPGIPNFENLRQPVIFLLGELCRIMQPGQSGDFKIKLSLAANLLFDILYNFDYQEPRWQRLYPLYYFHLKSWSSTEEIQRPSYTRYGLSCHLRLCRMLRRAINSQAWKSRPRHPDKQSREYDVAVAMTAFIRFCPMELSDPGETSFRRPSKDILLSAFIRALYAKPNQITAF